MEFSSQFGNIGVINPIDTFITTNVEDVYSFDRVNDFRVLSVDSFEITPTQNGDSVYVEIKSHDNVSSNYYFVTESFILKMCKILDIPPRFIQRCNTKLFIDSVHDGLKNVGSVKVMTRGKDVLVSMMNDNFIPISTKTSLNRILENSDECVIDNAVCSEIGTCVCIVNKNSEVVVGGEECHMGTVFYNSLGDFVPLSFYTYLHIDKIGSGVIVPIKGSGYSKKSKFSWKGFEKKLLYNQDVIEEVKIMSEMLSLPMTNLETRNMYSFIKRIDEEMVEEVMGFGIDGFNVLSEEISVKLKYGDIFEFPEDNYRTNVFKRLVKFLKQLNNVLDIKNTMLFGGKLFVPKILDLDDNV